MAKKRESVHEQMVYDLARDFREKTGLNIYQSQLTDLMRRERPDLKESSISQYTAIYVDILCAKGLMEKTKKNSSTNLLVK